VSACYQCHKCSSGCPIAVDTDWRSSQIMRLVQLGADREVLESKAIWLCASCEACTTRCPMGIDVAAVMDTLRMMAVRRDAKLATRRDTKFGESFLGSVRRHGRVFELGMLMSYKLRTGTVFSDLDKGAGMLLRGKLRLLPNRSSSVAEVRGIFERALREEKGR
ncbi:MAG: 4Fe-4S dicluster domain-containing protein, partial [Polyangiaceae bacterium]|nr:4Fe-4S dicluster domain-containing protein [Polyangiaceae bacterium]